MSALIGSLSKNARVVSLCLMKGRLSLILVVTASTFVSNHNASAWAVPQLFRASWEANLFIGNAGRMTLLCVQGTNGCSTSNQYFYMFMYQTGRSLFCPAFDKAITQRNAIHNAQQTITKTIKNKKIKTKKQQTTNIKEQMPNTEQQAKYNKT